MPQSPSAVSQRPAAAEATRVAGPPEPPSPVLAWALQLAGLVAFGAACIAVWWALVHWHLVSRFILPAPLATAKAIGWALGNIAGGGFVWDATWYTLLEVLGGFAFATATGVVLGVIAGETVFGQKILMPYLVGLNAAPKIAFAPLFVAWLGFGINGKIVMGAFIAFFPVVINTALGIGSASTNELLLFRSMEASRWQVLTRLKLPTALPHMFASFKLAIVLSVIGAIVAEFLGGSAKGLGQQINVATSLLQIDRVFAYIFLLSVMGILLYGVVVLIERRVIFWRAEQQERAAGAMGRS